MPSDFWTMPRLPGQETRCFKATWRTAAGLCACQVISGLCHDYRVIGEKEAKYWGKKMYKQEEQEKKVSLSRSISWHSDLVLALTRERVNGGRMAQERPRELMTNI